MIDLEQAKRNWIDAEHYYADCKAVARQQRKKGVIHPSIQPAWQRLQKARLDLQHAEQLANVST